MLCSMLWKFFYLGYCVVIDCVFVIVECVIVLIGLVYVVCMLWYFWLVDECEEMICVVYFEILLYCMLVCKFGDCFYNEL